MKSKNYLLYGNQFRYSGASLKKEHCILPHSICCIGEVLFLAILAFFWLVQLAILFDSQTVLQDKPVPGVPPPPQDVQNVYNEYMYHNRHYNVDGEPQPLPPPDPPGMFKEDNHELASVQ